MIKNKTSYLTATLLTFFILSFNESAVAVDKIPAGIAITSEGNVTVIDSDNGKRALKRGDSFYPLETIIIGAESVAQLKFTDGGLVQLIPTSEFRIDSYRFKTVNHLDESITSLAKGGLRALSGSIAKENPSNVTIKTPVATIGLLGTTIECITSETETYCSCTEGTIEIKNLLGKIVIGKGRKQFAQVKANQMPRSFLERPTALSPKIFTSPHELEEIRNMPDHSFRNPEFFESESRKIK